MAASDLSHHYRALLEAYGPQGWWPVEGAGVNRRKTGAQKGYHPGDFSYPKTSAQRFEICCGAILTQNTAWTNVERALDNLRAEKALDPRKILMLSNDRLAALIRPAGYFNQKERKLRLFAEFYRKKRGRAPSREELLSLWGIGPETADSILLYAYGEPEFVVDAYTKRLLGGLGMAGEEASYDEVKALCVEGLPRDVETYQEFHALVVEHAKRCARPVPGKEACILPQARTARLKRTEQ